MSGLPLNFVVW